MPGWNAQLRTLRMTSLLWHRIWVDGGREMNGQTYDIMKRTRREYHYAIRRLRKNEILHRRLKRGKGDGKNQFLSDHVIHGGTQLIRAITGLFNGMMIHGFSPDELLSSTIISIPKNVRMSLNSSENYCAIALCIALSKLLRWRYY